VNKIKLLPLTITAVITAAILFGGWSAYRYYGLEKPLDKVANAIPGVDAAKIAMTNETVKIDVKLSPDADLGAVYRRIMEDGAGEIGARQLELKATAEGASERLEEAWSQSLFDVAEAMENRQYSGVREAMDNLTVQYPGLSVKTDMDDKNVYISMKDGEAAKFVVLPRQPATLGVWPNA